jgi:outer membrane protein assembly factor BamB
MQGKDPQGTYTTTATGAPVETPKQRWRHALDDSFVRAEPILYDGQLFVGQQPMVGLDADSGERLSIEMGTVSPPAVAPESVYRNATLVALRRRSTGDAVFGALGRQFEVGGLNPAPSLGEEALRRRWRFPGASGSFSPWDHDSPTSPVVVDDRVLAGGAWKATSEDDDWNTGVVALSASTGDSDWRYVASGENSDIPFGRPSVSDGTVYVGTGLHDVYAIDLDTGEQEWFTSVTADEFVAVPSVVATEQAIVVVELSVVVGLDPADGEELWRTDLKGYIEASDRYPTTVADGTLFIPVERDGEESSEDTEGGEGSGEETGDNEESSEDTEDDSTVLLALDVATGERQWVAGVDRITGVPTVADGVLYYSTYHTVVARDTGDGRERWRVKVDEEGFDLGTPIVGESALYVAGNNIVYAFEEGA